jgi:predicted ArsR family transcriptional regulator
MPKKKEGDKVALTKEQTFYIDGNMEILSEDQLAEDLRLPVQTVRDAIANLQTEKKSSRAGKLMHRPAPGVVAMTESASMAIDDFKKGGTVTRAEINQASAAGNHKLAAELAERMNNQTAASIEEQKSKYSHCWHRIR